MLTSEEKNKILLEEKYRIEVSKTLAEQKRKSNKLLSFLNSALGIWFLSTIVIGLATYLFDQYKQEQQIERQESTRRFQIGLEISSRISQFWVHLEQIVNTSDTNYSLKNYIPYDTIYYYWNAFKDPPSFNPKIVTSIYKEYENRSIISLLVELKTLYEDDHIFLEHIEKEDFKKPLRDSERFSFKLQRAATFISANGIFLDTPSPTIREI